MSKGLPEGTHTLTPHLVVQDGAAAIEFYKKAFGAVEECLLLIPGTDKLMHASLKIGDSRLMLGGEGGSPECTAKSPATLGGTPVAVHVQVENVDEVFNTAIAAGAKEIMKPADMFWGDRFGKLKDPFGHEWSIATHVRDMSSEEIQQAAEAFFKQPQPVG